MDLKPKNLKPTHYRLGQGPACGAVTAGAISWTEDEKTVTCKNCLRRLVAWGVPGIRMRSY